MIRGLGSDVVQIPRIARLVERFGSRFITRILTKKEAQSMYALASKEAQINFLAKRFAAKEACVKALGIGFRKGVGFHDMMVTNDTLGKPLLQLSERIKQRMNCTDGMMHLSLSDDYPIAYAVVVMDG